MTMRRDVLEASVLDGLHRHLMEPELFKDFCDAFTRAVNRLRMESRVDISARREELPRIDRELAKLLTAIKAGGPIQAIVDDMKRLEARKAELAGLLAEAEEPAPLLHPNMGEIYRRKVSALATALGNTETRLEAAELIRTLVERVILTPEDGQLGIQLRGALAGILAVATTQKAGQTGQKPGSPSGVGFISPAVQVSLVAGPGFEPGTFRL
jgi:site-specific DNA recombinase